MTTTQKKTMIKVYFIGHKRSDMSMEAFSKYAKETHGPIAAKIPGLRKYIQSHALPDPDGEPLNAHIAFDSSEVVKAAFASSEGKGSLADLPNFLDTAKSGLVLVEEIIRSFSANATEGVRFTLAGSH